MKITPRAAEKAAIAAVLNAPHETVAKAADQVIKAVGDLMDARDWFLLAIHAGMSEAQVRQALLSGRRLVPDLVGPYATDGEATRVGEKSGFAFEVLPLRSPAYHLASVTDDPAHLAGHCKSCGHRKVMHRMDGSSYGGCHFDDGCKKFIEIK